MFVLDPAGKRGRFLVLAVAAVAVMALLAACSGKTKAQPAAGSPTSSSAATSSPAATSAPASATATAAATTVTVRAEDFSFHLDKTVVPAGSVHFVLVNDSKDYEHELWVYPQGQPKLQQMLAVKDAGKDVDEMDYLTGVAGKVEDVPPGKTASFDATLQPGTYELSCFITSTIGGKAMVHYEMGMHATLTVQ